MALSKHRPGVSEALADIAGRYNDLQVSRIGAVLERYGVDTKRFSPESVVLAMVGTARSINRQESMARSDSHKQAIAAIELLIDEIEPKQRKLNREVADE